MCNVLINNNYGLPGGTGGGKASVGRKKEASNRTVQYQLGATMAPGVVGPEAPPPPATPGDDTAGDCGLDGATLPGRLF